MRSSCENVSVLDLVFDKGTSPLSSELFSVCPIRYKVQMFSFGGGKPKVDIKDQIKEWQTQLKTEQRGLDRQVREVQRSEEKLKREIVVVAKKDPTSAKMLARNIVCPHPSGEFASCFFLTLSLLVGTMSSYSRETYNLQSSDWISVSATCD